jgi:transcriptional regulator with XRE-family HTH domain
MNSSWNQLVGRFRDKEYRDSFVSEQIYGRLPLKIRMLRDARRLTQKHLGQMAGMKQTWISKLEDPNYGKLTIATLLKIASALDVGLHVDFVSFSEVLDRSLRLSPNSFQVPSHDGDPGLRNRSEKEVVFEAPLPPSAGNREQAVFDISDSAGFRRNQTSSELDALNSLGIRQNGEGATAYGSRRSSAG